MHAATVELSNVIYNAATQSFEALATLHDGASTRRIPCAINAPIDMTFEDAAAGLTRQAHRRHAGHNGLASTSIQAPVTPRRTGRTPARKPYDALALLRRLAA